MIRSRITRPAGARILAVALVILVGLAPPDRPFDADPDLSVIHSSVQALTDVMVHDIFSPPQASRAYAYALIAYYEALRHREPEFRSYAGQLNGLNQVPAPRSGEPCHWLLAGTRAFLRVAHAMAFSEDMFEARADSIMAGMASLGIAPEVYESSIAYGDLVAQHVLAWADADGYRETRALPRYGVRALHDGTWQPTPPAYMDPVEPNWGKLRPFVLQDAEQYRPLPPPAFDMREGSDFYRDVLEVYDVTRHMAADERAIAAFWDCNPYVLHQHGHVAFALKQMSPGAHWIGISGIAIGMRGDSPVRALAAYSLVAIAVADGFIACWDEKYRSNLVRPETVIRKYIDPTWEPLLQTPPFPEYPSGHSVISTAAATVLTYIYGDLSFNDDVEVDYGIEPRRFTSFLAASEEAAISRLYGGIHFRPAIVNGAEQGRLIGEHVVRSVQLSSDLKRSAVR